MVDVKIRSVLEKRLKEYGGDAKKAFVNLDENPIWLNEAKGISIKRVSIRGISNAQSLHEKKDKDVYKRQGLREMTIGIMRWML